MPQLTSMVSHAQPPEQTHRASTNRGPSVASSSRSHTSRRHRTGRSLGGGSSYKPQNEFPNFAQTGDVEIVIQADGHERSYTLHRLILSQNSGFFEASTSEEWAKVQQHGVPVGPGLGRIGEDEGDDTRQTTRPLRNGEKVRLRYELDWGNGDDEVPMLVQRVRRAAVKAIHIANRYSNRKPPYSAVVHHRSLHLCRTSPPPQGMASSAPYLTSPPSNLPPT